MRFILFFLLGGVVCVRTSPSCSEDEARKCVATDNPNIKSGEWPETAAILDSICGDVIAELDCQIDYARRCPNTWYGAFIDGYKIGREIYGSLCDKSDPLRSKYLRTIGCVNRVKDDLEKDCKSTHSEQSLSWCKFEEAILKCVTAGVADRCGKEAAEVFTEISQIESAAKKLFCKE